MESTDLPPLYDAAMNALDLGADALNIEAATIVGGAVRFFSGATARRPSTQPSSFPSIS